jgi:hypothetical protein
VARSSTTSDDAHSRCSHANPEVLHPVLAVAFDDRRIEAKVSLLDDTSTLASGPVASAFGPSLQMLAPDEEHAPGGSRSEAAPIPHP